MLLSSCLVIIPLSYLPGTYHANQLDALDNEVIEICKMYFNKLEYKNPFTGNIVTFYDVSERDFSDMLVYYDSYGYLAKITLPSYSHRVYRTLWRLIDKPYRELFKYGDYFCEEIIQKYGANMTVSRLFVNYSFKGKLFFDVFLASPSDVELVFNKKGNYATMCSGEFYNSVSSCADIDLMNVFFSWIDDPYNAFKEFEIYITNKIIISYMEKHLLADNFCSFSEEYD